MDDGLRTRWVVLVVPLLLTSLAAVPARADLLVNRLNREPVAVDQKLTPCCMAEEQAAAHARPDANLNANALTFAVLATVLFSNPDNSSPQTKGTSGGSNGEPASGSGGGTTGGGGTITPTGHAPEPATLISALVGISLAGLFAAFNRKRLVKPESMTAA